jgi:hypothetical protein
MQVRYLLFLFFMAFSTSCFAQEKTQSEIVNVTKINFLNPGISYEKPVGKFQSLVGQAFLSTTFSFGYSSGLSELYGGSSGFQSDISFDPALSLQYRFYYNYEKRQKKGKRTEMNSLNYFSPTLMTVFSKARISSSHYMETNRRAMNTVGVVWGFQRNYRKRFSLDLNLGLGYLFTTARVPDNTGQAVRENVGEFTTLGQLTLGFWLNKR